MREISFALMLVAALMGCQKKPSQSVEQQNASPQKITVAYTYQPQSTLVHVAMAKGYFAEERLDVQPLMHTYGKAALLARWGRYPLAWVDAWKEQQ